jgi:uncharacterized protein (TIGR03790 family)
MGVRWWGFLVCVASVSAQKPENVLVVVNQESALSKTVGDYYVLRRHIPLANVCRIHAPADEYISRDVYDKQVAASVAACLKSKGLTETVLYIVTTAGVPLRVEGPGDELAAEKAAVDSELALLYSDMRGTRHLLPGPIRNPFFGSTAAFAHPQFPIYLVTRLAGYDFADIKGLIDRALLAKNTGKFVIDLRRDENTPGNEWLRAAARQLPKERLVLDETSRVLMNERNVIAYAGWGSNDPDRKQRMLGFEWLPGAIMTEFVSTNGRTFARPPKEWTLGVWSDTKTWFAGAPQTMTADYIHEGATGASGHVWEPYLGYCPRPDVLLPAYYKGRTLAESYYLAIPALSWQNIVIGDPLCSLGKP